MCNLDLVGDVLSVSVDAGLSPPLADQECLHNSLADVLQCCSTSGLHAHSQTQLEILELLQNGSFGTTFQSLSMFIWWIVGAPLAEGDVDAVIMPPALKRLGYRQVACS